MDSVVEFCRKTQTRHVNSRDARDRLIVFAPGFSGLPPKQYNPLLWGFRSEFDVLSLYYPYWGTDSIRNIANDLSPILKALKPSYKHMCIIGHSMGGLVGRHLIQVNDVEFDSYISIATPHKGTRIASFAPWGSAYQMRPGSKLLNKLNRLDFEVENSLTIQAAFDPLVIPFSSARYDKAKEHITIPNTEHLTVLTSKRTFYEIYSWLKYKVGA